MQRYEKYKDSGIDWLGEIPQHWELNRLKHLFKEKKKVLNFSLPAGSISFGEVVFKDDEKIPESTKATYQEVLKGDYLINPLNLNYDLISLRIALSDIDVVVSSGYIVIQDVIQLNKNYYKWLLHQYDVSYMKLLGSGVRQTISFNNIANSELPYPNLDEQEVIANFLNEKCEKIDGAIILKEQQIEKLKELRQITIHNAVTKGISLSTGKVVRMKDSGIDWIGEIPEHWEVKKLKYLFYLTGGGTPSKENFTFWNGSIPWVSPKDMKAKWIEKTEDYISEVAIQNSSTKLIPKNSLLLVVRSGILQRTLPLCFAKVDLTINQDIKAITAKSKMASEFLYYYILGLERFLLKEWVKDGATVESIEISYLENTQLVFPSLSEQEEIVAYLETQTTKIDKAIAQKQEQIIKLKEYKQSLINEVVTGKLKVVH